MITDQHIRLATTDDAEALGTIEAASYLATYRGIMPDSVLARVQPESMIERTRTRLAAAARAPADDPHRLWVIESDGAVAGYARTEPGLDQFLPPPEGAGEVESLYLHPDATGRGLGRALLRHAVDDLAERGFDPLVLWAFAANERARRFYERAGWSLDVSGEHWVLDGVPCPIVRYRLDTATRPS
ncbi:MAG: N-acetyltransferase family protein [Candidatus Limnocylindrales bacterium]